MPYPSSFFFFNDTATTEIYPLSLHDALPISPMAATPIPTIAKMSQIPNAINTGWLCITARTCLIASRLAGSEERSEEHTSELQSQSNLVCRLLLEKKKNRQNTM